MSIFNRIASMVLRSLNRLGLNRLGLVLPAMALASCSAPPEIGTGDALRIVSVNPCSDAILAEIAEPEQLLAISHFSKNPGTSSMEPTLAAGFAATGGTAEEVLALAPDIVIADSFMPPATRKALEDAGVQVEELGITGTLEQSLEQVAHLAALVGHPARGRDLAQRIGNAWNAAARDETAGGAPVEVLLWQEGGIVPGEGSLAAAMLEQAGFTLQSAARGMGQGAYLPLEQVLADPPQLVLATGDERMLTHPVLLKQHGIVYRRFDSTLLYCGGPTIIRALDRLVAIRDNFG